MYERRFNVNYGRYRVREFRKRTIKTAMRLHSGMAVGLSREYIPIHSFLLRLRYHVWLCKCVHRVISRYFNSRCCRLRVMTASYWTDFVIAGLGLYLFHSAVIGTLETHRRGGRSLITVLRSPWIRLGLAICGIAFCIWVGIDVRQKLIPR